MYRTCVNQNEYMTLIGKAKMFAKALGPRVVSQAVCSWHSHLELCKDSRIVPLHISNYRDSTVHVDLLAASVSQRSQQIANCEDQVPHSAGCDPSEQSRANLAPLGFIGKSVQQKKKNSGNPRETSSVKLWNSSGIFGSPPAPCFDARSQTRTNLRMIHQMALCWCRKNMAKIGIGKQVDNIILNMFDVHIMFFSIHPTYSR